MGIQAGGRGRASARAPAPRTARIILEVLHYGFSPAVERAIAESGQQEEIARRRSLRTRFLSRAEVVRLLAVDVPGIVNVEDYRGGCQMHSVWSDGIETIAQLAEGAIARGWTRIAITDHSRGLPIAGGMSIEAMRRPQEEIDALNQHFDGRFRILKGIEANILSDGSLDLAAADRTGLEMVLAAPHSKLRLLDDQTERMVAAVRTPGVHVLAHPRGRMSDSRPGIAADWDRVFVLDWLNERQISRLAPVFPIAPAQATGSSPRRTRCPAAQASRGRQD